MENTRYKMLLMEDDIARQLIGMHGGRIWAESTPGRGCVFCFTLPKYSEQIHASAMEPVKIS